VHRSARKPEVAPEARQEGSQGRSQRHAIHSLDDATEIGMKILTPVFRDHRQTIFGAEDEMKMQTEVLKA
jgi:hypothetical protein